MALAKSCAKDNKHEKELITQETLDPISIENNWIFPGEVNLNLTSVLCTIQK